MLLALGSTGDKKNEMCVSYRNKALELSVRVTLEWKERASEEWKEWTPLKRPTRGPYN